MAEGIHVVMESATRLLVALGTERYGGRFLYLPKQLRVMDRVWLRIERRPGDVRGAVDVTARVTDVAHAPVQGAALPRAGLHFRMTIDKVCAADPENHEPTCVRSADSTSFEALDDDEEEEDETERSVYAAMWATTIRDAEADDVWLR